MIFYPSRDGVMELERHLVEVIARELDVLGFELVKIESSLRGRKKIIRIYIDHHERGVTLDDCVHVTKMVGFVLDGEDIMSGPYNLEVSSPGINRPLTKPEHFKRFQGREAKIVHLNEEGEKETAIGDIVDATWASVILSWKGDRIQIPFERLVKANLHGEKWKIPKLGPGKKR